MTTQYDYIWKIIVGGQGGVGKTSLLHRYLHNEFLEDMKMTIGCQFHTQILHRQERHINLVMWDLGGQDRFRFVQGKYMRGAAGAFVLFDMSDDITFENVNHWIDLLRENASPNIPIVLTGTKMDLVDQETQDAIQEKANALVKEKGLMAYTATSSKWNINVDETILYLVDLLVWQAYQEENGTSLAPQGMQ